MPSHIELHKHDIRRLDEIHYVGNSICGMALLELRTYDVTMNTKVTNGKYLLPDTRFLVPIRRISA